MFIRPSSMRVVGFWDCGDVRQDAHQNEARPGRDGRRAAECAVSEELSEFCAVMREFGLLPAAPMPGARDLAYFGEERCQDH